VFPPPPISDDTAEVTAPTDFVGVSGARTTAAAAGTATARSCFALASSSVDDEPVAEVDAPVSGASADSEDSADSDASDRAALAESPDSDSASVVLLRLSAAVLRLGRLERADLAVFSFDDSSDDPVLISPCESSGADGSDVGPGS